MRIRYTNAYVFHATSCRECNLWLVCQLGAWFMSVHSLILFFHISWVLPFNFQTLPDQQHAYYLRDIGESSLDQTAKMVSRIPFTHPTNVANILNLLRQQLLFNTVISSCIRPYAKQGIYCKHIIFGCLFISEFLAENLFYLIKYIAKCYWYMYIRLYTFRNTLF